MTRTTNRPNDDRPRETHVRIPQQPSAAMFQGWGPKF